MPPCADDRRDILRGVLEEHCIVADPDAQIRPVGEEMVWEAPIGITLTVTAKGQVTLRKEVLQHLGIEPGDQLDVDLLPQGRLQVRARKSGKPLSRLYGILKRPGQPRLSIEEINEAAAAGWVEEK